MTNEDGLVLATMPVYELNSPGHSVCIEKLWQQEKKKRGMRKFVYKQKETAERSVLNG